VVVGFAIRSKWCCINGKPSGQGKLPVTIPLTISISDGLECGRDSCSQVSMQYSAPFAFSGIIHAVAVDVSDDFIEHKQAAMRNVMARR
jgi:hypothetical protein